MDYQLTVVVRFATKQDLDIQLEGLDFPATDDVEFLFIGYGDKEDLSKAENPISSIPNSRFEMVDGDFAYARTRACYMAKGRYVLFAGPNFSYDLSKALLALGEGDAEGADVIVLRCRNRTRIEGRKKGPAPALVEMDTCRKNYFQVIGCTLSYTIISKGLLGRICETPFAETVHDNAFIVAIAMTDGAKFIAGSKTNALTKREFDDDDPKMRPEYDPSCAIDSINMLIDMRNEVISECDDDLDDSFWRIFAARARTYLMQNAKYSVRKPVLDILSTDDEALSYFLDRDTPDWPRIPSICFEFVKSAIAAYIKLAKSKSVESVKAEEVKAASCPCPRVSMIVPVYNAEAFIEKTLQSALAQTYRDIEVICVDDGSADSSLSILRELAESDGRIGVYSQPNMGQSVARNVGLDAARGEYVYFFDADDVLEPNLVETAMQEILARDLDVVLFDAGTFYDSDDLAREHDDFDDYYLRKHEYVDVLSGVDLMFEMHERKEYRVSPCLYVTKKSVIEDNGIRFIPGIIHEDNAFTFELMCCASRAYHINEALYLRRVHEESVMTSSKSFPNSYGYFVCAQKLLSHDFNVGEKSRARAFSLAIPLSYSMLKLAQRDLLDAPDGQEGGAYALDDVDFRMFLLLILDAERLARKLEKARQDEIKLKEELEGMNLKANQAFQSKPQSEPELTDSKNERKTSRKVKFLDRLKKQRP